jgi:hypothetical protein
MLAAVILAASLGHPQVPVDLPFEPLPTYEIAAPESRARVEADAIVAPACISGTISCNTVVAGALEPGDCTVRDGAYIDFLTFAGQQGDEVVFTVRPASPSYLEPAITIAPPTGDTTKTPITAGGYAATLWFRLTSTGTWGISVGTKTPSSIGEYYVSMDCYAPTPGAPQACIQQDILCGQQQLANLTSQSCHFTNSPRPYQLHSIYGVAGDTMQIQIESQDFGPVFGIYSGATLLASSPAPSDGMSYLSWVVPSTGFYYILGAANSDTATGSYILTVGCTKSGCVYPAFLTQPQTKHVAYGGTTTITVPYHALGPVDFDLVDSRGTVVSHSTTATLTTSALTRTDQYFVRINNPCGNAKSSTFQLIVDAPPRRRVAGH